MVLADSFYYSGLEFAAVGAAEVEFVAGEADWDWVAGLPLAGSVAIGRSAFVFASVDHALDVDDDGAANGSADGFPQDLGFGLIPVFGVLTCNLAAALVDFGGAAAYSFSHFRRIVPGHPLHSKSASPIQDH